MKQLRFMVSRAANGYTINAFEDDFEASALGDCYIAGTQKEVGEVVRAICRGAFKDDDPAHFPRNEGGGT